jgi:hypothetical protein
MKCNQQGVQIVVPGGACSEPKKFAGPKPVAAWRKKGAVLSRSDSLVIVDVSRSLCSYIVYSCQLAVSPGIHAER